MDPIQIEFEFTGAEEAEGSTDRLARAIERLSGKIGELGTKGTAAGRAVDDLKRREQEAEKAARDLAQAQQQAVQRSIEFTTRLSAAAGAVQGLSAAFGSRNDAAGLVARMAATTAAMAQLGASIGGPAGAGLGGALGILQTVVEAVSSAQDRAAESARAQAERLREAARAADQAAQSMREYQSAASRISRARAGISEDQQREQLNAALQGRFEDADGARVGIRLIDEQIDQLRSSTSANREFAQAQIANLQASRRSAEVAIEVFERVDGYARDGVDRQRASGDAAEERWRREQEAWDRYNGAVLSGLQQEEASRQRVVDLMIESARKAEEEAQARIDAELAVKAAIEATAQREMELIAERVRAQQEADDLLIEANRSAFEAHQRQVEGYKEVTGVIVGGLTDALTAIATGEKTAEEAFTGMLASFLKYIAEQAALKAVFEGAEAIAAFATQRYDQGAMHLLAAGAYAGVAVAAGVGSVAVSSAAGSGARQSEPERGRDSGGGDGGGGMVVINWNSPVVTAGTRAELGRELQQTIAAGQSRYA